MTLTLNTREAATAFATLASITPSKTTKPVLQMVRVRPDVQGVELRATSLDVSASLFLSGPGVIGETVDVPPFLVPARECAALLREIDSETVEVEADGSRVDIKAGSGSFRLLGDDVTQFPEFALLDGEGGCTINGPALAHAIESVAFACAKEETRYAINGVLFQVTGDTLTLVGTDGRRLSIAEVECNGMGDERAVVPSGVLKTIAKAAKDAESVGLSVESGRAVFTAGAMVLGCQLLEDRFPIWDQVIPKSGMQLTFDREPLQHALARVSTICRSDVPMVRLMAEEGSVTLSTESASVGRADETLALECVAEEPVAISVNPDYLSEALKVAQADQIPVSLSDDQTPMVWSLGGGVRYILMPISGS